MIMDSERQNPYMGVNSYREEDGAFFFGREREVRHLTSLILGHRVVVFYAQSGAGKTSLLQAKLTPGLRDEWGMTVLARARVGGVLPPNLTLGKDANVYVFNTLYSLAGEGARPQELADMGLRQGLAPYLASPNDGHDPRPSLLILDQFEELFSVYPELYAHRDRFFWHLQDCLEGYPHLRLLLSMREDFIAHLDYHAIQMPDRLRTRFRMQRLDEDQALDAIMRPAKEAGCPFQENAAKTLRDNLRRIQAGTARRELQPGGELLGPYVEPLHLSVVCQRLWERLPPGDSIEEEQVQQFGDVDQTLIDLYEEGLDQALQAVKDTGCDERRLREWFEDKLITPALTRGTVFKGEVDTEGIPNEAVEALADARILRCVPRGRDEWYELVHDRLVEPIRQANLAVLDAYRKRRRLDDLGWGVIFANDADPAIHHALRELLDHRQAQARERYQAFTAGKGYRPGETVREFVERQGHRGIELPYYLLIVGDPERIPYEFQYGLAVQHAVGRIHFDSLPEYASYARSVVTAESEAVALAPEAVVFGVQHPQDDLTQEGVEMLCQPMARHLREAAASAWQVKSVFDEGATKFRLGQLLGGSETPALLFTFGRAVNWPKGDGRQVTEQGSPVCADWPGPRMWQWRGDGLPPEFYYAAGDVADEAGLLGLITFLLVPHSAGTPLHDDFAFVRNKPAFKSQRPAPGEQSFVAPLPRRLLGHPKGGALAVIGHVSDTWDTSFKNPDGTPANTHFIELMSCLMDRHTVGSAMEAFRQRYALLASRLGDRVIELLFGEEAEGDDNWREDPDLLQQRLMVTDIRNYVIVGDPAVYLPLAANLEAVRRPAIEPVDLEALLAAGPLPPEEEVLVEEPEAAPLVGLEWTGLDEAAPYLLCNGVRADTGQYLLPRIAVEGLAAAIRNLEGAARQADSTLGELSRSGREEF